MSSMTALHNTSPSPSQSPSTTQSPTHSLPWPTWPSPSPAPVGARSTPQGSLPRSAARGGLLLAFATVLALAAAFDSGRPARVHASPNVTALQQICSDGYEPNDSLGTAWPITPGPSSAIQAYICPVEGYWDHDWFSFSVPTSGKQIEIYLSQLPHNYDIKLYDPSGVDVAVSAREDQRTEHIAHVANQTGTWTVHVYARAGESSSTSAYKLAVDLVAPTGTCLDTYEPNEYYTSATAILPNTPVEAYLCPRPGAEDVDWYSFYATAGQNLRIELSSLPVNAGIALFAPRPSGRLLAESLGAMVHELRLVAPDTGIYQIYITCGCAGDPLDPYYLFAEVNSEPTCSDNNEPNDAWQSATMLETGRVKQGALCAADDHDWFRFTVMPRHEVVVELSDLPIDYDLRVYDAQAKLMARSALGGTQNDRVTFVAGGTGPYYAEVYSWDGDFRPAERYSVLVSTTAPANRCGDTYEPNEDFASAAVVSPAPVPYLGVLCDAVDEDWFRFSARAGQEIALRLTGQPSGDLPADYELSLHGPDGNRVGLSQRSGNQSEEIQFVANADGDYAVRIWGYQGAFTPTEYFALQIAVTDPGSACPDAYEPNDGHQGATRLRAGASLQAYICDDTDVDWFVLSATSGQDIHLRLSNLPADYEVDLFDANLQRLAGSANGGAADEELRYPATADGDYYVFVWGYQGAHDAASPYSLLFQNPQVGATPQPTTPSPTGCGEFFEPNDQQTDAHPIQSGIGQAGYICDASDTDWFRIGLVAGDQLEVSLLVPVDLDLTLRDAAGAVLASSAAGGTASEQVFHNATVDGDVFVEVFGYAGSHDAAHTYTLNAFITATGTPLCGEWFEPNENQAQAAALDSTVAQEGILCDADDRDWFAIPVAYGQRLIVELTRLPADYDIAVFDPAGRQVAASASGGTADERTEWVATVAGSYGVHVYGYNGVHDPANTYLVEAIVLAPGAPAQPTTALPATATPTSTATPWPTMTPTARPKPTGTATPSPAPKPTRTPGPVKPTVVPKPTSTDAPGLATATPSPAASATPTSLPKPSATATLAPTSTPTSPPKPTATAVPSATATPTSAGPVATSTVPAAGPTITPTAESTSTPDGGAVPTGTPDATPSVAPGEASATPPVGRARLIYLPYGVQYRPTR